jgi:4-amino-4-deoxy-L-arabinose transferase-like glycosyltransferase
MTGRRSLILICLVAALHGAFFIWYQRPDWATQWSDQEGYRRLGQVLAETGRFTRFPDAPQFVPEVLRTPAYPMFVAGLYRLFGVSQWPVAFAQTLVFVAICLFVYAIGRRVAPEPIAIGAAALAAIFPPIPYFGALVMTEVWTTFWFTVSMWVAVRAFQERRTAWFAWLGVLLALTTLSRPVFVLFPAALAGTGLVVWPVLRVRPRPGAPQWLVMLASFAIAMLPWLTYNYLTLGRFTLSPAGGVGRGLWEGSWQAAWPGRIQNELTHLADEIDERDELDGRVRVIADREQLPAAPMLEYVHQWEDIRRIWTEPVDPRERALARVVADQEYQRVGIANISRQSFARLAKRLARGIFVLWAGEIPFRYSDINALPAWVIRFCWAVQAALSGAAIVGVAALARSGRIADATLLAAPIVYVTAVHFPLLTEARQSLPAQPIVLLLAAIGVAYLTGHRGLLRSLSFEAQVHERQHLRQP